MTDPRPADVPWLTPYLTVRNARASIDFFQAAFGFALRDVLDEDGAIMHVEMVYRGQLIVMFAPEGAFGSTARTPKSANAISPQSFYLYVDDVDATWQRALDAGAKSLTAPQDQFWGDRFAQIEDLDGYRWALARRLEA
ncbi:glyoxalase/bleomycin resistance protein/dioxygenase [Burkholderia multivorans]|uniref:Glyoxalase/bleomycin resistance protein/dioxygenase n=1 Tax=Burkholderia multivorans TaxID=87883 RepID=A0ABD7LMS3_9BURK|nr:glyoxalase/bleomycin resistance/extradiol dioxygenase family protein [Burkholderia multivorans]SAK11566.1 glyoxalase/bleomycin resistance protein/dioxygenase [Burkholderia multivorans]SAK22609.1 glyoxalase/bleomycin resistance protein/dioxygenase [Burkholderia multivorans]HEF5154416.1 glyoxalase/bleomycin resistance/extradiol dioxygenase family protein [Burkholderia multivorans]